MHRNADSALKLGQARGAAICAVFAIGPAVFEYAPREVKLAIVGQGGAQKDQVQLMVRTLLKLQGELGPDAADAIGIALCHAYSRRRGTRSPPRPAGTPALIGLLRGRIAAKHPPLLVDRRRRCRLRGRGTDVDLLRLAGRWAPK